MADELKRYICHHAGFVDESPGGDWVKAKEALAVIAEACAQRDRAEDALRRAVQLWAGIDHHSDDCPNPATCAEHLLAAEIDAVLSRERNGEARAQVAELREALRELLGEGRRPCSSKTCTVCRTARSACALLARHDATGGEDG